MKKNMFKMIVAMIFVSLLSSLSAQDFGDHKSSTLTTKAWNELGKNNSDLAVAYADKCIELYMKEAVKMQNSLQDFSSQSDTPKYWALNDVGTCLYIKAQALLQKGKKKEALAAFKELTEKLKFAQCWDPNGWFWKPSEAAKEKMVEMELE